MPLSKVEIEHFRCVEYAKLDLDQRCNVILGANGSGKTSVLEACYLLGSGHSFRTHRTTPLIRQGADSFMIVGKTTGDVCSETLGILGLPDAKEFRVAGQLVRGAAELASRLPIQVIDPEVHRLIEDGPNRRRQFLDWGVFHVEPQFHSAWQRYSRALRQRNASLKMGASESAIKVWDKEFVQYGTQIALMRDTYLSELLPSINELSNVLLDQELLIEHQRGWRRESELFEALETSLSRDLRQKTTTVGPHRAELQLRLSAAEAKLRVSRGQQKMLACVLFLAQQLHRVSIGATPACLLFDDPAAELDVDNLGKLMAVVARIPVQLVVTTLSEQILSNLPAGRLFHVERGNVHSVA